MIHQFYFNAIPTAKGRPRMGRHGAYTPDKTRAAECQLKLLMRKDFRFKPLTGPLHVIIGFFVNRPKRTKNEYPVVKPDVDNFAKLVCDSGNDILWRDDSQIVRLECFKCYATTAPHIMLSVTELV